MFNLEDLQTETNFKPTSITEETCFQWLQVICWRNIFICVIWKRKVNFGKLTFPASMNHEIKSNADQGTAITKSHQRWDLSDVQLR